MISANIPNSELHQRTAIFSNLINFFEVTLARPGDFFWIKHFYNSLKFISLNDNKQEQLAGGVWQNWQRKVVSGLLC